MANQNTFANSDIKPSEEGLAQVMHDVADEAKEKFNLVHDQLMTNILNDAKRLPNRD